MSYEEFLDLAREIAVEAGERLAKRPARPEVVDTKSSPTDVVTALDRETEELIRARIKAARPGDAVLGEEGGETPGEGRVRWIVDPIDGTVNFLYGLPAWAISIAVELSGEVVAGVVNVVPTGEVFTATKGGGAWLAGERLRCNTGVPLDRALVATGFGYEVARRRVQGEVVAQVLPRVRDIRRGGSCAVDLCSVAAGRVDAYYERGPEYWDFGAGGLVATEAGARIGGLHGKPHSREMTICAAPDLFPALHDLLAPLDPERDA
ncbi:inositol monophosphatase family protein [Acrocarpospora catenulata]|uniref:inositol monophosphatase family protein n=1 Tax=Acrocarpospora catenulata TaxID=2836182 RepID=UPI001BD99E29|nr:inositol monophosphatase family protein [Acrocarpospora catenulata]